MNLDFAPGGLDEDSIATCGCGGKAVVLHSNDYVEMGTVMCKECGISVGGMMPETAALTWNAAMGKPDYPD